MHEWMTIAEAAERLGVDRGTVYRMVKEKRLAAYQPAAKKQGKVVRRAEVEALAGMRTARDQENSLPNDAPTVTMQLLDLMQHPPTQVEWVVRWTEGDRHY
ncbi:MAG TPA: helix-turn-helix domain-containing protein, partial [Armatimonadota bacterium]|nr:helix-turn-helix domain-containing protein [Armatimonadota bacterium]